MRKLRVCAAAAAVLMSILLAACAMPPQGNVTPAPSFKPEGGAPPTPAMTAPAEATAMPDDEQTMELPAVEPFLTLEEFPAMDGSTANLPLMAAAMASATGMSYAEASELVSCTTTPYAYVNLIEGNADLLLVYEGAQSTQDLIAQSGVKLELTPIGRDALVFIGNENNAVASLSQQQLRDIYTGKITNWSQLGGKDQPITPFQREESSGSQALFIKLLMQKVAPMQAPTELAPQEMGELIERLAEYNNEGGAIGYSVFYYANYMYAKPGLKFFQVDGVAPSDETIASAAYPFCNPFYVVVRADEPAGSPARKLAEWILSEQGRSVMRAAGYVPISSERFALPQSP